MIVPDLKFEQNHFQLFGLSPCFKLERDQLERAFLALQSQIHPDKSAHLSDLVQRIAMQNATRVNEAYQTLKSPIRRARYLLLLQGVDTQEETNTVMPIDFLMTQMEWREAVIEAEKNRDLVVLGQLESRIKILTLELETELASKIDVERDYTAAAGMVRKLRFMEKLAEEISTAYDELDR